ncbi:MAG: response regulator [Syntrophobacteraceae bacterium]|nr:response regulator [Syntrophobacteraceae bacterium]
MDVMEAFRNSKVIVVDDDQLICETLTEVIQGWGLDAEAFATARTALEGVGRKKCDVILLDIFILDVCGLDLISQFGGDVKIIIITGYADKEIAIRALKLGAFDLLEKPFQNDLLYHSVVRALKALENERESKRLIDDLKQSRSDLLMQQQRLESLNTQLLDTNRALSIFAQNIEREREEIEKRIAMKLRNLIIPMVVKLKNDPNLHAYAMQLDMLARQVEDLTTGFAMDSRVAMALSFTELQIASLIKNGVTTDQIARQLHIAESTVRTHRKNIRRKLKINNAQFSLRNYLNVKS